MLEKQMLAEDQRRLLVEQKLGEKEESLNRLREEQQGFHAKSNSLQTSRFVTDSKASNNIRHGEQKETWNKSGIDWRVQLSYV